MKKRIITVLLAVLMALSVFTPMISAFNLEEEEKIFNYTQTPGFTVTETFSYETEEEKLADMKLVISNKNYEMYMKEDTGEFIIKDKRTGQLMASTPYAVSDVNSTGFYSVLNVTYTDRTLGGTMKLDSFTNAAAYGQMKISVVNSTRVDVTYALGEIVKTVLAPKKISNELMVDLQKQIVDNCADQKTAKTCISDIRRIYSNGRNAEKVDYNGATIYSMPDDMAWEMEEDLLATPKDNKIQKVQAHLKKYTNLTVEAMFEEYEKLSYEDTTSPKQGATFFITLEYTLNEDGFTANVNADKINFDTEQYALGEIEILPYFNIASVGGDTGYAFVPDGSGALVRYENQSQNKNYPIYGFDYAYTDVSGVAKNQEQSTMPVFGSVVNKPNGEKRAFFAVIEDGDTVASVFYNVGLISGGITGESIFSKFKICPIDKFKIENSYGNDKSSDVNVDMTIDEHYHGNCTVKYTFLFDSQVASENNIKNTYEASYVGMAKCYRDYLIENDVLSKITDEELSEKTKIFLEVFGSIKTTEKILTFPVEVNKELTTFEDIIKMYKQLNSSGVGNMSFILTGFINGGLDTKYPTYLKWQKVLGGKKGYASLVAFANENDMDVSLNVDFLYSRSLKSFSGFSYKKTAGVTLEERYTTKREYDPARQIFRRTGGVVISSGSFELAYAKFMKDASKYEITSIAPRTLGSDLNSDFDQEDGIIFRNNAKENTQKMLAKFKNEAKYNVILDKGNAYTLAYADGLLNVPIESSNYNGQDEIVPFVGMVLHGCIEFASAPINMEGDERYAFLKSLENGSVLYFTLAMQNIELLKSDQTYNKYYSIDYEQWKTTISSMYTEYNKLMASKQNSFIDEHEFLNNKDGYETSRAVDGEALDNSRVVRVEYENGEGFILNYNTYAINVTYGGQTYTIESMEYVTYVD